MNPSDVVEVCSTPDCHHTTIQGDHLCRRHRTLTTTPRIGVAYDLTPQEIDELRRQVARDAAIPTIVAMAYINTRALIDLLDHQLEP